MDDPDLARLRKALPPWGRFRLTVRVPERETVLEWTTKSDWAAVPLIFAVFRPRHGLVRADFSVPLSGLVDEALSQMECQDPVCAG